MAAEEETRIMAAEKEKMMNARPKVTPGRLLMLFVVAFSLFAASYLILDSTRMPRGLDYGYGRAETLTIPQRAALYKVLGRFRFETGTWPVDRKEIDSSLPETAQAKQWDLQLIRIREGNHAAEYLIRMESGMEYRLVVYPPSYVY